MASKRSFLFLQSVCSPFFARLADQLLADGHRVFKVNFTVGDVAYWWPRPAVCFRGSASVLASFLDDIYRRHEITDQILFGDRRPVHRPAVAHGEAYGIRTHVFEEGYFRPYWITLEREGVNGHSLLPRDPDWFWRVGEGLPNYGNGTSFKSRFSVRAAHDVGYHAFGFWNPLAFPGYRTHAPVNAAVEYLGFCKRLPLLRFHAPRDAVRIDHLVAAGTPFFVLPLQLGSDAQIRDHSRFDDMEGVISFVLASLANRGPAGAHLVIKNHPLDMGWVNYRKIIAAMAKALGLIGRVHYLETGNLEVLLKYAKGTVTVNSTVGALALGLTCPTICLSDPIYNLPGLTFQGALDDFWGAPERPDRELFRRFRNTVIHTTQINGGFYCGKGIALAVENCRQFLTAERSPLERLL